MTQQEFDAGVNTSRGISGWIAEFRSKEGGGTIISAPTEEYAREQLLIEMKASGIVSESMGINHGG